MLPFVALSAWAVLRIVKGGGGAMWLVLGLAQALGLLTKYQMGLCVIANAAALLSAGRAAPAAVSGRILPLPRPATLLPPGAARALAGGSSVQHLRIRRSQPCLAGLGPLQRFKSGVGFVGQQARPAGPRHCWFWRLQPGSTPFGGPP